MEMFGGQSEHDSGRQYLNLFLSAHKWAQCRFKAQTAIHTLSFKAAVLSGNTQPQTEDFSGVHGSVHALIQCKQTFQQKWISSKLSQYLSSLKGKLHFTGFKET